MSAAGTILVVDDEPAVVRAVGRILRGAGYEVLDAGGGQEALAVLGARPVDVMMSDLRMPGVNGLELLTKARAMRPAMVSLVLSASVGFAEAQRAINEGGVFRYLSKPCDHHDILAAVKEAMSLGQARRHELESQDRSARRAATLAPLRRTNPEVFVADRDHDAYVIDEGRARDLVTALEPSELKHLLARFNSGGMPALPDPVSPSGWGPAA